MSIFKYNYGIKLYEETNPHFKTFRKYGNFPSNLTLGFENEIVYNPGYNSKLDQRIGAVIKRYPYLYLKEECSNNGVELNSHPFNWNWFQFNQHFIQSVASLSNPVNFRTNNHCGFHIHLVRKFFNKKHLTKMVKFFYSPEHDKFLFKISKRNRRAFEEYSNTNISCNVIGDDCVFKEIACMKLNDFDEFFGSKLSILNLAYKKTIEIRMFKGTVNPVLFQAYLEFAVAVTLFTKITSYNDITIKNFRKYVKKNIRKYFNLYRLISRPSSLKA